MKHFSHLFFLGCAFLSFSSAYAQKCPGHPLFSNMPNFEVLDCKTKEFDKLEFTVADKSKNGYTALEKSGEFIEMAFKWLGA